MGKRKKKKKKHPLCNLILILKKSKATTWRLQIYNYRQFVTVDTFIIGKSRWLGRYYIFHFFLKKKHPDLVSIISNHDRQLLKQIFHYYWFTGKNVLFFFFFLKGANICFSDQMVLWYSSSLHVSRHTSYLSSSSAYSSSHPYILALKKSR